MARKPWAQLSPNYRQRLEKAGISQRDFEAGASIKAARGHAQTPERPGQYNPAHYPKYAAERQRLNTQLEARKAQVFGGSPRWDAQHSQKWLREKPPSIANLRWAVHTASDQDLIDAIREDPETFTFIGYH